MDRFYSVGDAGSRRESDRLVGIESVLPERPVAEELAILPMTGLGVLLPVLDDDFVVHMRGLRVFADLRLRLPSTELTVGIRILPDE